MATLVIKVPLFALMSGSGKVMQGLHLLGELTLSRLADYLVIGAAADSLSAQVP